MTASLSNETWAQIRHDYEHTDRPVEEICAEHGISSGTLRDRMRRWGWTRRRPPIPAEGPPRPPAPNGEPTASPLAIVCASDPAAPNFAPQIETTPPASGLAAPCPATAPQGAAGEAAGAGGKDAAIVPRLQSAVDSVLPAIETIVAKLAAGATHPRELERAARALAALTRTLRELNNLLSQRQTPAASDFDDMPEDIDAFRHALARRIRLFVASRTGKPVDAADPQQA